MRRKDREISDINEIESIINKCDTVRIGMVDGTMPYVVPMNFGYTNKTLYLHCAREGRKLEILQKNNNVCVEFDNNHILEDGGEKACEWGMKYESVIGFGKALIVSDINEKKHGLNVLMSHYAADYTFKTFDYPDAMLDMTVVIKIEIETISGKRKS